MHKPTRAFGVPDLRFQVAKVGCVLIPDSLINNATSRVLRGVMEESGLQQKTWAAKSGMSLTVVQKLLSGNQSVKIPQLLALVHATGFSPEEVMERINRAVQKALSETPDNVTDIRPKRSPEDGAQKDFDGEAQAAHRDVELDEDEPGTP